MAFGGTAPPEDLVLPSKYATVHLREIKHSTRLKIALYLNLDVVLNDEIGLEPNYRGLAELVQFSTLEIRNLDLPSIKNPTEELLDQWEGREDLEPTVGNLWDHLKFMERVDVLTDIWPFIERDCEKYLDRQKLFQPKQDNNTHEPVQVHTVSQSSVPQSLAQQTLADVLEPDAPKVYDAFVCYNPEGTDLQFVLKLIDVLERQNNLRLFIPWRDDLSGTSRDTICAQLIEKRCKRMIIVLSPRFLESVSCDFQIQFAHSLSPGARNKKLVPIIIERCDIPEILRHVTCCDYTKTEVHEWFWRRLIGSLRAKIDMGPASLMYEDANRLEKLNFDTSMEVSWSEVNSSLASSNSLSWSSGSSSLSSPTSSLTSSSLKTNSDISISTSVPRQFSSNESTSTPVYEKIDNVSRSRTSRLKNFLLPQKKRPVPPIPNQR